MKSRNAIATFTGPLLGLAICMSVSGIATAQVGANPATEDSERSTATTPANESGRDEATTSPADGATADTDCIDINSDAAGAANDERAGENANAPATTAQIAPPDRDDCLDLLTTPGNDSDGDAQDDDAGSAENGRPATEG